MRKLLSPPAWGAWIETASGVGGSRAGSVAPRVGGVDCNSVEANCLFLATSPPAWGAWIATS